MTTARAETTPVAFWEIKWPFMRGVKGTIGQWASIPELDALEQEAIVHVQGARDISHHHGNEYVSRSVVIDCLTGEDDFYVSFFFSEQSAWMRVEGRLMGHGGLEVSRQINVAEATLGAWKLRDFGGYFRSFEQLSLDLQRALELYTKHLASACIREMMRLGKEAHRLVANKERLYALMRVGQATAQK